MADIATIERNINKMRSMGAGEDEINIYKQGALQQAQGGGMGISPEAVSNVAQAVGGQPQTMQPIGMRGLELQGMTFGGKAPSVRYGKPSTSEQKEETTLKETQTHFNQAIAMFKGIIAQQKGAAEEQGGLGLSPGLYGFVGEKTKRPGFGRVSAAYGQTIETAARMNRILTGQNRVIKSVINMIMASLPGRFDPPDQVAGKITQSITNAYKITKAFEKSNLTPDILNKMNQQQLNNIKANEMIADYDLSPQEQQELEGIIQNVLTTPAAPARTLSKKTITLPSGKTITLGE